MAHLKIQPPGQVPLNPQDRKPIINVIGGDSWHVSFNLYNPAKPWEPALPDNTTVETKLAETQFDDAIWSGGWFEGVFPDKRRRGLCHINIPRSVTENLRRGSYMFSVRVSDILKTKVVTEAEGSFLVEYKVTSDQHSIPYKDGTSESGTKSSTTESTSMSELENIMYILKKEIMDIKQEQKDMLSSLAGLSEDMRTANENIEVASTAADSARQTANVAQNAADQAVVIATAANTTSELANVNAGGAKSTADDAHDISAAALSVAAEAHGTAESALSKAEQALTIAENTNSRADAAENRATSAENRATAAEDRATAAENRASAAESMAEAAQTSATTALTTMAKPYPFDNVQITNGTVALAPFTHGKIDLSAEVNDVAFEVAVGAAEGKMRDLWFEVITGTASVTITWPSNTIAANEDASNLEVESSATNIFMITEYSQNKFMVARQVVSNS